MKKPTVTLIKKYLTALNKIKAKYITSERLSKVLGVYPENINEVLSYFDPMLMMDYSYNLLDLKDTLEEYVSDEDNKRTPITTGEVVTKRILSQYQSINDFIYQKMSIAGLIDKNAYLSDADLRALKRLIQEEQARRKKK
jgi:NADH/NAD ratio-sensing transcriptional regulator Rex